MKISDYVPELYQSNLEMTKLIKSEEKEFENNLKPSIDNAFKDNFIVTATNKGISNFEEMLNIIPDIYTENLELRRARIINRLRGTIPFTERFLVNQLNNIIGEGNWEYTISYNDYELTIDITIPGKTWLIELNNLLTKIIPCNILWTVNIFATSWQSVKDNYDTWQDVYDTDMTWKELMDGEWL